LLNANQALIHVADINGVHGLKGALIIYSHTRPAQAVAGYSRFYMGKHAEEAFASDTIKMVRCQRHGQRILLQLESIHTPEQAQALLGNKLWIKREEITVDEDEYLWDDLIGMQASNADDGSVLGMITDIHEYGAQDTLIISSEQGEWMIPFIDEVVIAVDDEQNIIQIHLLEGMEACFTPKS